MPLLSVSIKYFTWQLEISTDLDHESQKQISGERKCLIFIYDNNSTTLIHVLCFKVMCNLFVVVVVIKIKCVHNLPYVNIFPWKERNIVKLDRAKYQRSIYHVFPNDQVVRIRRSHHRGRGLIPRLGEIVFFSDLYRNKTHCCITLHSYRVRIDNEIIYKRALWFIIEQIYK